RHGAFHHHHRLIISSSGLALFGIPFFRSTFYSLSHNISSFAVYPRRTIPITHHHRMSTPPKPVMDLPDKLPPQPAQSENPEKAERPTSPTKRSFSTFQADNIIPLPRMILLHADALIDGREALTYTIAKVLAIISPQTKTPTPEQILATVASTPSTPGIYRSLGAVEASADDAREWCLRHNNIMKRGGSKRQGFYPEAEGLLKCLKLDFEIPTLIITSADTQRVGELIKGQPAFENLISGIVGYADLFLQNKDHFSETIKSTLAPWFAQYPRKFPEDIQDLATDNFTPAPLRPEEIMVVSCCPYNLVEAHELGVQTCWVKMANASIRPGGEVEVVVDTLKELQKLITLKSRTPSAVSMCSTGELYRVWDKLAEGNKMDTIAEEEEAGPSGSHRENVQEKVTEEEATKSPNNKPETKDNSPREHESENVGPGGDTPMQSLEGSQKNLGLDQDVVMLGTADSDEILETEAVEGVAVQAVQDQPIDDDGDTKDPKTDAYAHKCGHTPETVVSPQQISSSPQVASSQPATSPPPFTSSSVIPASTPPTSPPPFTSSSVIPSSPPRTSPPRLASSPVLPSSQTTAYPQEMTRIPGESLPQNNDGTLANATRDTDSPLSDICDVSD
ncbi:hypothetical protein QBC39DRAFT_420529, partial [Podospora conica]